ncbi:zinc finger CCCH domain-containing protein 11A isoform X1 [Rhineura floridana]|uniref:zinc finger CCCH domain-containing protein 11A isoform X1 n=1 Tax=Rhineura floridana TaxID=261503 RepID=UPI002AC82126|nr:zinc finger CCCH domain-containing protein 11A isoform X1 [Rhineura floridana]XP_061488208.1 zinc finger CCCH domain-containing protein 11A isoform X1 [Rhineura floridana]XP_061488209.1 zinc finger CCCH domain-containing protein 11A isoform X1 [Rhineura floridana]XP_061488210.1 zinc finger CCCH domain-containing protein 11A isoform X1 [Rhineura floridana]XP_061488211.1 zinc finger CCCH domain-containing protein 11A isoform X1 [Rhineura floridana]XP_061488212.1 zinc finger CCCH domain-contai
MSNQGDDCYFYFYSTCTKGDSCPFRHCEAALGNETVCVLWQEGRCFRSICRFRHMEIDKKRSEIPCYWENQPVGCQKLNCAFHHNKGRFVDGLFLPPSKTVLNVPEPTEEEMKATQISLQQNKLSVQSNPSPQLRGVMKVENSENVPSPTHPPVVINAADDDEDDDDQLSEEGDETKMPVQQPSAEVPNGLRIISTRKTSASTKQDKDDILNFGIKTLEEIKSKKMKEKSKKQGDDPSEVSAQTQTHPGPEKENVRTVVRTVTLSTKQGEEPQIRLTVAERFGKRKLPIVAESGLPLKRSLAERLGKKIDSLENADKIPKRVQVPRSLKERLGLPSEQNDMETENAAKPAGEIRVKTLEEIRLEKASQRKGETQPKPKVEVTCTIDDPNPVAKPAPTIRIKTFSEVLAEKKQRQMEEEQIKAEKESLTKPKHECEPQKPGSLVSAVSSRRKLEEPSGKAKDIGEVHIKTLEEIKQEKALRMQQSGENTSKTQMQPERTPVGRRLLCITKPIAPGREEKTLLELKSSPRISTVDVTAKPLNDGMSNSHSKVYVKSLEEIRKEKQQLKEQQKKPQEEPVTVPPVGEESVEGKATGMINPVSPVTSEKTRLLTERLLVRSQEVVPANVASEESRLSAQPVERRTKAKPKVNMKPSGVKPMSPVKQTLKRKASESHPSVIAAVRPLSLIPSTDPKELPSENTALASAPGLPEATEATIPERVYANSSELHTDNQVVSTLQAEVASATSSHAAAKTRRLSSTGAGKTPTSVEDDFEKLIWEISGGKLEAEIDLDPGKDEDALLLELSEMIDS